MAWTGILLFAVSVIGGIYLVANMGIFDKPKDTPPKDGDQGGP